MTKNSEKNPAPDSETATYLEKTLLDSRTVLIFGEINMKLAQTVTGRLMSLSHTSTEPIKVIVNSPGGHVEAGDTMHDMLKFVNCPIYMIGTGWVASAGALIYLGVPKSHRFSLPNTRFLLHQPSGGMRGPAADIEIQAREIIKMRERLNKIISKETGMTLDRVEKDTDRDYWLSSQEAQNYGIVGKIIHSVSELKP
jgi:ATP-dependent Clp protease protease subunit